jgi:predicted double-glycine peptidase
MEIFNMSTNLNNTNTKISLETFLDMKKRVEKYLKDGGVITEERAIPLDNSSECDYVTYTVYKDMLKRYNSFVSNKGREPKYITTTMSTANNVTTDSPAGKRFTKSTMEIAAQQIQSSISANRGLPSAINMIATDNKTYTLSKPEYAGLFESRNVDIRTHGRYPNYVTMNSTANNPIVSFYQSTMYTCCPRSLANAIMGLYGKCGGVSFEKECAKALQTQYDETGTIPGNIQSGAKKLGYTATIIERSGTAVRNSLNLGKPVLVHLETGKSTKPACLGYKNNYGHYVLIYAYSGEYYKVLDPTKGLKTCTSSSINHATNGRAINYYSISP